MMVLLLSQVVLSSLALARQADVDMQLHDAWGRAAYSDQRMVEKIEKTVQQRLLLLYLDNSWDVVDLLRSMIVLFPTIALRMKSSGSLNLVVTSWAAPLRVL
jgi:hypothetical protein